MVAWMDRVVGVKVRLHPSTYLMAALLLVFSPSTLPVMGIVYLLVLLHELGHCYTARWFGLPTEQVLLTPIGGLAEIRQNPQGWSPVEELVIAAAGPLVNALLTIPLAFLHWQVGLELTESAIVVNLLLLGFNLLPAFPMDGGRILRAGLALLVSRAAATKVACIFAWGLAALFIGYGLMGSYSLLLIGPLIMFASAAELQLVSAQEKLAIDR